MIQAYSYVLFLLTGLVLLAVFSAFIPRLPPFRRWS
jgi:hypothetical protein